MKVRYKISLILIGLMLVGCLYITQSYALWIMTSEQKENNEIEVGCFSIEYTEESASINLNNTYPVSDSIGLNGTPYTFKIKNTCTVNNNYLLTLNVINTSSLDESKIKYALYKSSEEKPSVGSKLSRINNNLENLGVANLKTSYVLDNGILSGGTKVDGVVSNGEEVTYNLYLWIDDIAGNEVEGQTFEASVNVINEAIDGNSTPADEYIKSLSTVASGDGLYEVSHEVSEINNGWNQTEYRYAGVDPDNYVKFNDEIWRIIGLVNVNINNKVEQRVKIVRNEPIGSFSWDINGVNDWTQASLMELLNDLYYNSTSGNCYRGDASPIPCNFNLLQNPKGLDDIARKMIDKEVSWNIGGWSVSDVVSDKMYSYERGLIVPNERPSEWNNNTTQKTNLFNGVGLLYPTDYSYSVGGEVRNICLTKNIKNYNEDNCCTNDWIFKMNEARWLLTPNSSTLKDGFYIDATGSVFEYGDGVKGVGAVLPSVYLNSKVVINDGNGTKDSPYILSSIKY